MEWKFVSAVRRQFYIENMRKNFQFSLILISVTLIGLQIYLTLFFSKHKVSSSFYEAYNLCYTNTKYDMPISVHNALFRF